MFKGPNWKKIGDNVYLSVTGVLALSNKQGGVYAGWIKMPEVNAKSYSYRYRPKSGGKTRKIKCDALVLETFGVVLNCDADWFNSISMICDTNRKKKFTPEEISARAIAHAERCEDLAVAEVAMMNYPHHDKRQTDFWSGF